MRNWDGSYVRGILKVRMTREMDFTKRGSLGVLNGRTEEVHVYTYIMEESFRNG